MNCRILPSPYSINKMMNAVRGKKWKGYSTMATDIHQDVISKCISPKPGTCVIVENDT